MRREKEFAPRRYNLDTIDMPADNRAEKLVLGTLLSDGAEAFAQAEMYVNEHSFALSSHRAIFLKMREMVTRNDRIDLATLCAAFTRVELGEIGGAGYLAQLTESRLVGKNLEAYAKIVREKERAREMVTMLHEGVVQLSARECNVDSLITEMEETILRILHGGDAKPRTPHEVAKDMLEELTVIRSQKKEKTPGLSWGVAGLDALTTGIRPGEYEVIGGRTGDGKTALMCQSAMANSRAGKKPVVMSVELRPQDMMLRLVSHAAKLSYTKLRSPELLSQKELDLVGETAGAIADSGLLIDDCGGMSRQQLEARMRLHILRGADVLYFDYLQKLAVPRGMTRYDYFTEASDAICQIAKRTGVPVVMLSQIARPSGLKGKVNPNARPTLHDFKECLDESSLVTMANGSLRRIGDLEVGEEVLAYSRLFGAFLPRPVTAVMPKGEAQTLLLTLASGRTLRATKHHPLLTGNGWKFLDQLTPGESVAIEGKSRHVLVDGLTADEAKLLGYMAGDGYYQKHRGIGFINKDRALTEDVRAILGRLFADRVLIRTREWNGSAEMWFSNRPGTGQRPNHVRRWMESHGVVPAIEYTKLIPSALFMASRDVIWSYVAGLVATDGCVTRCGTSGAWRIKIASTSRSLLEGVQHATALHGVGSTMSKPYTSKKARRPIYNLTFYPCHIGLLADLPLAGRKRVFLASATRDSAKHKRACRSLDFIPGETIRDSIREYKEEKGKSYLELGYFPSGKRTSRKRLLKLLRGMKIDTHAGAVVAYHALNPALWDSVVSVAPAGTCNVYDITVDKDHAFVANGIVSHNSGQIENDAFCAVTIYRPKAKDGSYTGEDELILHKQRNGSPGTVECEYVGNTLTFGDRDSTY